MSQHNGDHHALEALMTDRARVHQRAVRKDRPGWSEVETSIGDETAPRYETPSQFVQGTIFKLDRMKRHLRILREIHHEYPASQPALDQHMTTALDHVVSSIDRSVIDTIKAGLRDLGEI